MQLNMSRLNGPQQKTVSLCRAGLHKQHFVIRSRGWRADSATLKF